MVPQGGVIRLLMLASSLHIVIQQFAWDFSLGFIYADPFCAFDCWYVDLLNPSVFCFHTEYNLAEVSFLCCPGVFGEYNYVYNVHLCSVTEQHGIFYFRLARPRPSPCKLKRTCIPSSSMVSLESYSKEMN